MDKYKLFDKVADLALSLFDGNVQATAKWMVTPNEAMFGQTPSAIAMSDDADLLIKWLEERIQREPEKN